MINNNTILPLENKGAILNPPELTIDPEFKSLIPALSPEEYRLLEESIKAEGCREDLIVWKNGKLTVIDGHNRLEICRKYGVKFGVKVSKDFRCKDDVKEWIITNQLGRRNLTDSSRAYFIGRLYESRKKRLGGDYGNQYTKMASVQSEHQPKTEKIIANEHKSSPATVRRSAQFSRAIDRIAQTCGEAVKQQILKEEIKITQGEVSKIASLPQEKQKVIFNKIETGEAQGRKSLTSLIKEEEKKINKEGREKEIVKAGAKPSLFQLFNGNSEEILKTLPDNSIDLVLTDPPYAIDYKPSWSQEKWSEKLNKDDTIQLLKIVCRELKRVCKENAHLYFFSGWKAYPDFINVIAEYFDVSNLIVWVKNNTSLCDFNKRYAFKHEFIIFAKQIGNNNRVLNEAQSPDVLEYARVNNPYHSCEKPVELLEYIIKNSTIEGEAVLDCFMGSGNSGVASVRNKRKYIGIEKEVDFFNKANGLIRREEEKIEQSLF